MMKKMKDVNRSRATFHLLVKVANLWFPSGRVNYARMPMHSVPLFNSLSLSAALSIKVLNIVVNCAISINLPARHNKRTTEMNKNLSNMNRKANKSKVLFVQKIYTQNNHNFRSIAKVLNTSIAGPIDDDDDDNDEKTFHNFTHKYAYECTKSMPAQRERVRARAMCK